MIKIVRKKSDNSRKKRQESEKSSWEAPEKVRKFDRLSEETPWVQLDDLSLCQSALPNQGEVRGNENWKSGHPMKVVTL